jgi:hypothetical protein
MSDRTRKSCFQQITSLALATAFLGAGSLPLVSTAQNRGRTTSAPCPHSCATQGIPKNACRDWREGKVCFVEDLRFPPQGQSSGEVGVDQSQCRNLVGSRIARPRVRIDRVKPTGNVFGDKVKVEGTIEGVCISEAGLFEDGDKKEEIRVTMVPEFRRYEFEVRTKINRDPEIRVYNIAGDSDEESIELEQDSSY